jgi:GSH-dependent disulfide-bond oxidoreductase
MTVPSGAMATSIALSRARRRRRSLARGKHPLQLYLAAPNGVKVTIMLEEVLTAGYSGAEYCAWLIRISEGNQFGSGFVG